SAPSARELGVVRGLPRLIGFLLLAGLAASCASRETRVAAPPPLRPRPPATTPATPAPSPPVQPPAQPPAPAAPAVPAQGAQAPGTPGTPQAGAPPTTAPPAPRPAPPAGRGRQIVLNFDNADIEAVIQAASEIAGFNYTIAPGVAGKKVTVQTSGRIPEDEVFNVLLAGLQVNGGTAGPPGDLYKIAPPATPRERPLPTITRAPPP